MHTCIALGLIREFWIVSENRHRSQFKTENFARGFNIRSHSWLWFTMCPGLIEIALRWGMIEPSETSEDSEPLGVWLKLKVCKRYFNSSNQRYFCVVLHNQTHPSFLYKTLLFQTWARLGWWVVTRGGRCLFFLTMRCFPILNDAIFCSMFFNF